MTAVELPADAGRILLPLARAAIARRLGRGGVDHDRDRDLPAWARDPCACFVTIELDGALRGCIGSLEATRPLADGVAANAQAAAFRDPRFPPVGADELDRLVLEISVLGPIVPLLVTCEVDALAQLRVGIDGLVLECDGRRATFLPRVWDTLPEPREFLGRLKVKAGLPADFWSERLWLSRFRVTELREQGADHG